MIKSRLAKRIVFGLIFSIIFGLIGLFLHKKITLNSDTGLHKKLYVIETSENGDLNKFRNMSIHNPTHFFIEHFFSSMEHSLFMFNRTNKISTCVNINVHIVDLSIILESTSYNIPEEEILVSCVSKLISKSFNRFKKKVVVIIEDAILYKKLSLKKLRLEGEERRKKIVQLMEEEKKNSSIYELEKSLCDGIDVLFKNAIENVDVYLKNNKQKNNEAEKPTIIDGFLSLDYLISLSRRCKKEMQTMNLDNIKVDLETLRLDSDNIKSDLENLRLKNNITNSKQASIQINEITNQIREIQDFVLSAKLEDLFTVQIESIEEKTRRKSRYLTETQTLVTFLILGFIVGLILSSNFLAVSKKDK